MLQAFIEKRLGDFFLSVNLQAEQGILSLLGASGSGKSMTLKCIAGVEKPDRGLIKLNGRVLFDSEKGINLPPQERRVGYLFQQYALFPHMTLLKNVEIGVRRGTKAKKKEIALAMIEKLNLTGLENNYPGQLSGGQQQRAALGRILVNQPEALLLDEPFSALDSFLKWQLEAEFLDTLEGFSGPVLFVSHDKGEVRRLSRQVCLLNRGKSEEVQPVEALFQRPASLSAGLLTGRRNFSRIKATPGGFEALDWGVKIETDRAPGDAEWVSLPKAGLRIAEKSEKNAFLCGLERVFTDLEEDDVMLYTPGGRRGFSRLSLTLPAGAGEKLPEALYVAPIEEAMLFFKGDKL